VTAVASRLSKLIDLVVRVSKKGDNHERDAVDDARAAKYAQLFEEIKAAYRRLAKANHPDAAPGDAEAAGRFQAVQAAYDVLKKAEERRVGSGR